MWAVFSSPCERVLWMGYPGSYSSSLWLSTSTSAENGGAFIKARRIFPPFVFSKDKEEEEVFIYIWRKIVATVSWMEIPLSPRLQVADLNSPPSTSNPCPSNLPFPPYSPPLLPRPLPPHTPSNHSFLPPQPRLTHTIRYFVLKIRPTVCQTFVYMRNAPVRVTIGYMSLYVWHIYVRVWLCDMMYVHVCDCVTLYICMCVTQHERYSVTIQLICQSNQHQHVLH